MSVLNQFQGMEVFGLVWQTKKQKAYGAGLIRTVLLKIHNGLTVSRVGELLKTVRCCITADGLTIRVMTTGTLFVKSNWLPCATTIKDNVRVPDSLIWYVAPLVLEGIPINIVLGVLTLSGILCAVFGRFRVLSSLLRSVTVSLMANV